MDALDFSVCPPTHSRLKPVPLKARGVPVSHIQRTRCASQNRATHGPCLRHTIQRTPHNLWDRLQPGRGQHRRPGFLSVPTDAFPAKAGPTKSPRCASQPHTTHGRASQNHACMGRVSETRSRGRRATCGTGFSREDASMSTLNFAAYHPTHSRLKPVPLKARGVPVSHIQRTRCASQNHAMHGSVSERPDPEDAVQPVGPASAGKRPAWTPWISQCAHRRIPG